MQKKKREFLWMILDEDGAIEGWAWGVRRYDALVAWFGEQVQPGFTLERMAWERIPRELRHAHQEAMAKAIPLRYDPVRRCVCCAGCEWDIDQPGLPNDDPEVRGYAPEGRVVDAKARDQAADTIRQMLTEAAAAAEDHETRAEVLGILAAHQQKEIDRLRRRGA